MKNKTYKVEASFIEDGKRTTEMVTFHGMASRDAAESHFRAIAKHHGWTKLTIKHITLQ